MSEPTISLAAPPATPQELARFPAATAAETPDRLYRIFHHRHHKTGALNSAWNFGSVPPGANRFDLPSPHGTCYWSDRRYGCWIEVWRRLRVVDRADVTRRRLFTASPPPLRLADTLAKAAHRFGITLELSAITPYPLPQAWAAALHRAGFAGLIARCRHDPSTTARNIAIFGPHGRPARRTGWTVTRSSLLSDPQLAAELAELEISIAPVPHTVPISAPVLPPR